MTRDADGNAWGRLLEFHDQDEQAAPLGHAARMLAGDGSEYRRALLSQGLQIAPSATSAATADGIPANRTRKDARALCHENRLA